MMRTPTALLVLIACGWSQVLVDTVGYTNRDRQMYGPALRYIANDTLSGVHVVWKDGLGIIRYNLKPRRRGWLWSDTGVVVNPDPRNLGSLDVDITNGRPMISTDYVARGEPTISYIKGDYVGVASFREVAFGSGFRNCLVGTTNYGWYKFGAVGNDSFYYRSILGSIRVGYVGPFPAVNLAVSKQIGRYGYIWAVTDGPDRGSLFLKETPNNGANWYETRPLSDSVPSRFSKSLLGACATYDSIKVHLVADFYDGQNPHRSQIWHYSPYNTPAWHLIHDCACPDSVQLGDLALSACRPSIGMNRRNGELCAVWEQFDPANIDRVTGLARADVWASRSQDRGMSWGSPIRLTEPDSTSKRFPYLAEVVDDTLRILYFADQIAGFWEQGQGEQTTNAVVHLRVAADFLPTAIAEKPAPWPRTLAVSVLPTLSTGEFSIRPMPGIRIRRIRVLDNSGRVVAEPPPSERSWGETAAVGVYFLRIETDQGPVTMRVTRVR